MGKNWNFSNLTLEAMFQNLQADCLKRGAVLTRAQFMAMPITIGLSPKSLLKLFELGITEVLCSYNFMAPSIRPKSGLVRPN